MITEQHIRNVLESLTYKAAAGSTIAVEAIAVITELAKLRAEPPRPAAIVQVIGGHFHGFESDTDALAFRNERDDVGISQHSVCYSWTWHARAAEGEAT